MKKLFFITIVTLSSFALHAQTVPPPPPPQSSNQTVTQDGADDVITTPTVSRPDTNEVFTYAEEMPSFPGGDMALYQYLKDNIKYPAAELAAGIQGTVYVQFNVQKDGSITDVAIRKAVPNAPGFSEEAIRVISAMPKWTPGKMNGHPVIVTVFQPVKFVLPAPAPPKQK